MQTTTEQLSALIGDLLKGYTVDPVTVKAEALTSAIMIEVQGSTDDHRRLVGSKGRHIWSLQRLAGLCGSRMGKTVRLSLLNPKEGQRGRDLPFDPNERWNSAPFMELLSRVLSFTAPEGTAAKDAHAGHNTTVEITLPAVGPMFGEYAKAMQALFFAIGKMQGRLVQLVFVGPEGTPIPYDPL